MATKTTRFKDFLIDKPIYTLFVILIGVSLFAVPNFASSRNIVITLIQACDLGVMACGLTFIIMNRGIDFSTTAIMSLSSVVGASIMTSDGGFLGDSPFGFVVAILAMLATGLVIGALNGFAVTVLKMPSFMATMSMQLLFSGMAMYYTQSASIANLPKQFLFIAEGKVFGIPFPLILTAAVMLVGHYLLTFTVFGTKIFAVGINQKTAFISGINVKKSIFTLFVINGVFAALAGILATARIGAGKPDLGGGVFIDVVTAVIIGGTSLFGGYGSMVGTLFGVLFISALNVSLSLLGVQPQYIMVAKGLILTVISLLDAYRRNR